MEPMEWNGIDQELYARIKKGWDSVAKPLDGMGRFESVLSRIGAIQGNLVPAVKKSRLLVCCADNGIVEEGVSQSGQEITAICAVNIAGGRSSAGIMAKEAGADLLVVDLGINTEQALEGVRDEKIRKGSRNFRKEPAMTAEEVDRAIRTGMELVRESKEEGYEILATGEMGIGNTTTSSAVTAALLLLPAELVTGRGAGLNDGMLAHKREVIQEALEKYGYLTERKALPDRELAMEVLTNLGGYDIACLAGICLGGAKYRVPIVLDGFISLAAALVACRIAPVTQEFLIASHSGKEMAVKAIEKELSLMPVIYADMALGEGTGALLMLQLLKTANAVYEESCSFEAAGIDPYQRFATKGRNRK